MPAIQMPPMQLFITFSRQNGVMRSCPTSKQRKNGAVAGKMDWPLMRYSMSLGSRIRLVDYYYEQIIENNVSAVEEAKEGSKDEVGTSRTIHYLPLLVNNFEIFCDQIYKTMENIANINLFILRCGGKGKVSNKFFQQRKSILDGIHSLGKTYDSIVGNLDWLDELRNIRDVSNHYLAGFGVYRWEGDQPVPQYHTYPIQIGMNALGDPIQIDILAKAEEFYQGFTKCMDDIGQCYLDHLDLNEKCQIPFFSVGKKIQFISISLNDILSGNLPDLSE